MSEFNHKKYLDSLQIIERTVDGNGVHLRVKNKDNGYIHVEGHDLSKKDLGNRAILRECPNYSFPEDRT